jgi:hypothetical protein
MPELPLPPATRPPRRRSGTSVRRKVDSYTGERVLPTVWVYENPPPPLRFGIGISR